MKKRAFTFICIATLFVGLYISFLTLQRDDISLVDTVAVNQLVKQSQQNWGWISENSYTDCDYGKSEYDFTIIDINGAVVYSTVDKIIKQFASYNEQINEAIQNRDILVDLIVNGEMVGKLIIKDDLAIRIEEKREKVAQSIFICFFLISIMMLGYFIYLERKVFHPFHTLKQFAVRIAAGNLDTPVEMDKNNAFGVFTESFDLMREALKTARQSEYQANKSKKELVASLSHDIKNPVASIKAICETMALATDDRHITTIKQKAELIDALISDMFQSTLEELGELKVKTEEYSSDILLQIIEDANYDHKIYIVSKLPECLILCDKLRLTQIIDNVLGNSYKYAATDIHISFELKANYLQVSIKDFGKGISEEEISLILEKFYRGKNAEGKDGAGLGLYLSKTFMNKMGGQIECLNVEDGFMMKLELKLAGSQNIKQVDL